MFITDIISMLDNGFIVNIQVPRRRVKKVKNKREKTSNKKHSSNDAIFYMTQHNFIFPFNDKP